MDEAWEQENIWWDIFHESRTYLCDTEIEQAQTSHPLMFV